MSKKKQYDMEYKKQAIKLAEELGGARAARELGLKKNTLYTWVRASKKGYIDMGEGSQNPEGAMSLTAELIELRKQVKEQKKKIKLLEETNEFLEEASAFFAASRLKSAKNQE